MREYWPNYYESTDALVYVVDSADSKRLKDSAVELDKLLNVKKYFIEDYLL